jgi:hypothetical protein
LVGLRVPFFAPQLGEMLMRRPVLRTAAILALSFTAMTSVAGADQFDEDEDDASDFAYEMADGGYADVRDGLAEGEYQSPGLPENWHLGSTYGRYVGDDADVHDAFSGEETDDE